MNVLCIFRWTPSINKLVGHSYCVMMIISNFDVCQSAETHLKHDPDCVLFVLMICNFILPTLAERPEKIIVHYYYRVMPYMQLLKIITKHKYKFCHHLA